MGFLDDLISGGQQHSDYHDFVNRYQQGSPDEGYSDAEVMNRYRQIAPELSPDQYTQAAQAAFERMSPQQRQEFAQYVQQQAAQNNVPLPGPAAGNGQYEDPQNLARATTTLHQEKPGILSQLLGGGGGSSQSSRSSGGGLQNTVAKAALAGIAAMAAQRIMGGGIGGGQGRGLNIPGLNI